MMSPRSQQLLRSLAMTLQLVDEHARVSPQETDEICQAIAAHIRAKRPLMLAGGVP